MTPRMKSSKKWTAFPKEYSDQIEAVFKENFADHLGDASLQVEGRIYTQEVMLRVGIRREGELRQSNFEASMDYSPQEKDALERIHNCIDAAGSMMMDYFEADGESDLPFVWNPFPFQNKKVFLRYSTENPQLEAEADKLLGLSAKALVQETAEPEDLLDLADETLPASHDHDEDGEESGSYLETDEDEEPASEDKSPRMFSSKTQPRTKKGTLH